MTDYDDKIKSIARDLYKAGLSGYIVDSPQARYDIDQAVQLIIAHDRRLELESYTQGRRYQLKKDRPYMVYNSYEPQLAKIESDLGRKEQAND